MSTKLEEQANAQKNDCGNEKLDFSELEEIQGGVNGCGITNGKCEGPDAGCGLCNGDCKRTPTTTIDTDTGTRYEPKPAEGI